MDCQTEFAKYPNHRKHYFSFVRCTYIHAYVRTNVSRWVVGGWVERSDRISHKISLRKTLPAGVRKVKQFSNISQSCTCVKENYLANKPEISV